jgi:pimeloyl-ACP methyl ester carboxylesterase
LIDMPAASRSRFIEVAGSRRHLLEWGEPGAPVVLLQHGMRDHARSWDWVAARLQDRYHVIAPDLRGHGESDWSADGNYAAPAHIVDLADIFACLDLRDVDVVGHSWGGHLALQFAAAFPRAVRSLLVIEGIELPLVREQQQKPLPYPELLKNWIGKKRMGRTRTQSYYPDIARAQQHMAEANPAIDAETVAHLTRTGLTQDGVLGYRWKYDGACRLRPPDDQNGANLDEVLEAIACPTFLAYGDDSWIPHPAPDRLARIRQHRLVRFANASHWIHHQRRDAFCDRLETFIADPAGTITSERDLHA